MNVKQRSSQKTNSLILIRLCVIGIRKFNVLKISILCSSTKCRIPVINKNIHGHKQKLFPFWNNHTEYIKFLRIKQN